MPPTHLGAALALIAVGSAGPVLPALDLTGLALGLTLWALAALGMGLASPTLAVEVLAQSPDGGRVERLLPRDWPPRWGSPFPPAWPEP